ncbi:uncharacterized protein LOC143240159 isoform X2 [Tachypleus tridentatus]|uniref:uncharacterized protein LOC143240159 isoform X2 n=1 Tax=Tachypleus tridentatus TaxID=6853 RepID=UPI003FD3F05F
MSLGVFNNAPGEVTRNELWTEKQDVGILHDVEELSQLKDGVEVLETGKSLKLQTDQPHLVSLGGGRLSTSVTIHPLPEGITRIGRDDASTTQDVVVQGPGIEKEHCYIENVRGLVKLYPIAKVISVDGMRITEPLRLVQGSMICVGKANFFRFNHPQEARKMKMINSNMRVSFVPNDISFVSDCIPTQQEAIWERSGSSDCHYSTKYVATQRDRSLKVNSSESDSEECLDFVQKGSKFEFLSHNHNVSQTSQDIPQWLTQEGVYILPPGTQMYTNSNGSYHNNCNYSFPRSHSLPPSPVLKCYKALSSNGISHRSLFSSPSSTTSNGFPFSGNQVAVTNCEKSLSPTMLKGSMKIMSEAENKLKWCSPNSSYSKNSYNHHLSAEDLRIREEKLEQQHIKAVEERRKEEEQQHQESLRLEEILNMCAEYEHQSKIENEMKKLEEKRNNSEVSSNNKDPLPSTTLVTNNAMLICKLVDSYSDSSYYAGKDKTIISGQESVKGMLKLGQTFIQQDSNFPSNSNSPLHSPPYQSRIKTNGSLPRDRPNHYISPTRESQTLKEICDEKFINGRQNSFNAVYSEDELTCILNPVSNSQEASYSNLNSSTGTLFVSCPHSPRNRIRTVAVNEKTNRFIPKDSSICKYHEHKLNLDDSLLAKTNGTEILHDHVSGCWPTNSTGTNDTGVLHYTKSRLMNHILILKKKLTEIEDLERESVQEFEMEQALLEGEQQEEKQKHQEDQNKFGDLLKQQKLLDKEEERVKTQDMNQLEEAKKILQEHQQKLAELVGLQQLLNENSVDEQVNFSQNEESKQMCRLAEDKKEDRLAEHYKLEVEMLETKRKAFEDLEFQHLEHQTHFEEEKDALNQKLIELKNDIQERHNRLQELTEQQKAIKEQIILEKTKAEMEKKRIIGELNQLELKMQETDKMMQGLQGIYDPIALDSRSESSSLPSDEQKTEVLDKKNVLLQNQHKIDSRNILNDFPDRPNKNCDSCYSFDSESSSVASTDLPTGSLSSSGDDPSQLASVPAPSLQGDEDLSSDAVFDNETRQQETTSYSKNDKFLDVPRTSSGGEVRKREKLRSQRPLTRYLPVRGSELNLRHHIETAGHQIELCPFVQLTSTSCRGYLHKLGGALRIWKRRWFVFDRNKHALVYYSDRSESKVKGGVYFQAIEEVYVDHLQSSKSPYPSATFCVKTYDRTFYLAAPSPEAMRVWVDVIFTGAEGYQEFLMNTAS